MGTLIDKSLYIDGAWVAPMEHRYLDVINPATESVIKQVRTGGEADVSKAVEAARRAFEDFSLTTRAQRIDLFHGIVEVFEQRRKEVAAALMEEMGAPLHLSNGAQVDNGIEEFRAMIPILEAFEFETHSENTLIVREPVGVCALITPWNWPIYQIACKVAPALAAGCTMVLKPSEIAPLCSILFTEILHEAGVPDGVFNLVNGDGASVGRALASHGLVDMVSFTGSTAAGVNVAIAAAPTVKRVHQELGGKSPNIILPGVDLGKAVRLGMAACFNNSGQSCSAPTRMYVQEEFRNEAIEIAHAELPRFKVGNPNHADTVLGPVVSALQFELVQAFIASGIRDRATLVGGGTGRPDGLTCGYYVKPTVFADVTHDMQIAREEIFGPVLSIITYKDEEEAIALANDTRYGLSACIQCDDPERARRLARRIRSGTILLNHPAHDRTAPFGGYKQSGNGRECGPHGLQEFLELKAIAGYF
ncbi:aldehyde dehydrogenase family protein [Mesorhizobium sp. A623]